MQKLFLFIAAVMSAASINFVQADPVIPRETDGYLHYDDGNAYATMGDTKFWGVEFQAGAFEGVLTEVMVYTENAAKYEGGTLTMHISSSTGSINTRTDRYHQVIEPDENEDWQYISLETPLQFAENENCWILLEYSGDATSIATISPNTEFVGVNWRIYDDAWVKVNDAAFMIRAYFDYYLTVRTSIPEDAIWSEDFENNYTPESIPEGWTEESEHPNWTWGIGDYNTNIGAHSGEYNFMRLHTNYGHTDMLISPEIDLGSGYKNLMLGFWFMNRKWGEDVDTLKVYYRNLPDEHWNELKTYEHYHNEWSWNYEISVGYQEGRIQFGFEVHDGYGYGVAIDDIYLTGKILPAPTDAEPEGEKLTVYDDGTVTEGRLPYYGLYADAYTRSQYVIPAADLTSLKDMNIQAIRWYSSNTLNYFPMGYGDARFDVYLKEVNYTAISDFEPKAADDILFHGEIIPTRTLDGMVLVTIELDQPFTYHGGNLLVGCDNTVMGTYLSTYFYGEEVANAAVYGYSYSSLDAVTTATVENFIPKTTFYYTDPSTGIESIVDGRESKVGSRKILHDGQLFILRDGKIFNAQGARVK